VSANFRGEKLRREDQSSTKQVLPAASFVSSGSISHLKRGLEGRFLWPAIFIVSEVKYSTVAGTLYFTVS
jgi:hypothetical protein